ncbi:MAG: 4Fe-4S binding protein [Planctomycetota bacterium]
MPCDTLISAVGQTRTLEILPDGVALIEGNRTTHEKLFVSGDFHTGPLDVIHAVVDGKTSPRACIHQLTRLFTDEDGAPTGHIKSATAPEATYIWIESDQCIRCGNCHRACPTYAIPIRKADVVYGPIKGLQDNK